MEDGIRIGAAATALGVSIDTLRRWERSGRVTFERRGQQRYLGHDELARLLRERSGASAGRPHTRLTCIALAVRGAGVMTQVDIAFVTNGIVCVLLREADAQFGLKPG